MFWNALLDDLRLAARGLRRARGFTVVAVLTLGLAIGVLAGLYSVVHRVLLTPLPVVEPERLFHVSSSAPGSSMPEEFGLSREFLVHYAERSRLIEQIGSYSVFTNTLRLGDRAERIWMSAPSASLFPTLSVAPALGRWPNAEDRDPVVVISDRVWAEWFDRDPQVIGRQVEVFGAARSVVGVMPAEFRLPEEAVQLWFSRAITASDVERTGQFGLNLVVRARPGVDASTLAQEFTALARELPGRFGGSAAYAELMQQFRAVVRPLAEQVAGPFARPLWILLGAAALLLLIACANLANLFLVRAQARQRELAVRRALGAGRAHLLRLTLSESTLVALLAGVLALGLATVLLPLLLQVAPAELPRRSEVGIGVATVFAILGAALLASLLCGLLPAIKGAGVDLNSLREGGRGLTTRQHGLRQALVAGQAALALLLLVGAGLLMRSTHALLQVDPGYDPRQIYTFQIAPEQSQLKDASSYAQFHLGFLQRLAALPGVESAGIIENLPLNEGTSVVRARTEQMSVAVEDAALVNITYTAGDYFRSMDIGLLAGREFTVDDQQGRGHILVSRTAAERLWPGRDPIGQRLQREGQATWETVVGVVEDVLQDNLSSRPEPLIYLPLVGADPATSTVINSPAYVLKTARADVIGPEVRALLREVAPEAPLYREFTLEGLVRDSMTRLRFTLLTLGVAAGLALLLGAIGLYGVLSCMVVERTREIGIRVALGALPAQVRGMVVRQGARVVALGVAGGLATAALLGGALDSLLYGVNALDPFTYLVTALLLLLIGWLASAIPAHRAAALPPVLALRRE